LQVHRPRLPFPEESVEFGDLPQITAEKERRTAAGRVEETDAGDLAGDGVKAELLQRLSLFVVAGTMAGQTLQHFRILVGAGLA
jgi:hypothetical protein